MDAVFLTTALFVLWRRGKLCATYGKCGPAERRHRRGHAHGDEPLPGLQPWSRLRAHRDHDLQHLSPVGTARDDGSHHRSGCRWTECATMSWTRTAARALGVRGGLYISGAGVARVITVPRRHRRRFVAGPFGPPGTVMYRTGDLVRWNHDGELEFMAGPTQVKIHGFVSNPTSALRGAHGPAWYRGRPAATPVPGVWSLRDRSRKDPARRRSSPISRRHFRRTWCRHHRALERIVDLSGESTTPHCHLRGPSRPVAHPA